MMRKDAAMTTQNALTSLQFAIHDALTSSQNMKDAQDDMLSAIIESDMVKLASASIRYERAHAYEETFERLHEKYQNDPDCLGARFCKLLVSFAEQKITGIPSMLENGSTWP